jgi:Fe(3+) dicitrate transport protein
MALRLTGIEVFKGPAAITQGPQTVGGAVNLLTRRVPDVASGAVDAGIGLRSTAKVHAWAGTTVGRWGVMLEGAHLSTAGFKELDTGGPTGFVREDALLKIRGEPSDDASIEIKLGYGREESDETYLGLSLADYAEDPYRRYAASALDHMSWDHDQESVSWAVDLGAVDVSAVAYRNFLGRSWRKFNRFAADYIDVHDLLATDATGQAEVFVGILRGEVDTASPDQELLIGTNNRRFENGGVQLQLHHVAGGERVGNELRLGARLHGDDATRLHTEDAYAMTSGFPLPTGAPTDIVLDSRTTAKALATWVSDDLRLGIVHVVPGTRVEWIRTAAGTRETGPVDPVDQRAILPGIGALVEARPWLDLLGGVHRGFSPVAPGSAPDVEPETAWAWEAGGRAHAGELQAELVGFWSDYDNLVGACTLSGGCSDAQVDQQFNGGEAAVYGVEALFTHHVGLPGHLGLGGTGSYTYTRSEFRTGFFSEFPQFGSVEAGDALPYVPVHQGAVTLYADHPRGEIAVSATGRTAMRDVAGQGPIPRGEKLPGGVIVDVAATVNLSPSASAYLDLTNVANAAPIESFRPFGARPPAPFAAMVGVKVDGAARRAGSSSTPPG